MDQPKQLQIANILRNIARYALLVIGLVVFIFALLSGSEGYGGGVQGVIKNSPNALPWLGLLILVGAAWKYELAGGITIVAAGAGLTYFFNFHGPVFYPLVLALTLSIAALGSLFILSWHLRRDCPQLPG